MCSQKKISCLFHIETIELDNFHRKDNMLIFFKLILDFDVLFKVKVIIPKRDWLWLSACSFVGLHHLLSTKSLLLKLIISLKNVINQENNLWRLCERSDTSDRYIKGKQILREGSAYTRRVCCRWGQSDAQMLNMEVVRLWSIKNGQEIPRSEVIPHHRKSSMFSQDCRCWKCCVRHLRSRIGWWLDRGG